MKHADRLFLVVSATCLIAGVAMGIGMGAAHDFQLAPVHAHLNLVGWVSLAIFGLAYRAYPELSQSRLAAFHLALSGASGVLFPISLVFAVLYETPGPAIATGVCWFLGACVFLGNLVRAFFFAQNARPRLVQSFSVR